MCIIAYTKERKMTRKEFDNCWDANPDGFGMAYAKNGTLFFEKGIMEKEKAWDAYSALNRTKVAMHFRIKTAGAICPELTHPFIISKSSPTTLKYAGENNILFHNGCIWGWEHDCLNLMLSGASVLQITGHMSDSRFLALKLNGLNRNDMVELLRKETGKFILMNNKHITLIGDFENSDGIEYSNSTYKTSYVYSGYTPWKKDYDDYYPKASTNFVTGDYVELRFGLKGFEKGEILKVKAIKQMKHAQDLLLTDGSADAWVYSTCVLPIWFDEQTTEQERNWTPA